MLFTSSPKQDFAEQNGFSEQLKWHRLKCVSVLAGAFQMPALKSLLQITLTRCGSGFAESLGDLHRGFWAPKPPQEGLHLSGDQMISAHETFPVSERRSCFLLMDLEYSLAAAGFICMAKAERKEGSELVCEVLLCPSAEPGSMLLPQPTSPERYQGWRTWQRGWEGFEEGVASSLV